MAEKRSFVMVPTKLDKHQQRYSVTRRELLAVITFMHQYRHYLIGRKCVLMTDHGSLRWLFAFKDPQGQIARWLETLSQYQFEIEHIPGLKHQNADALSRTGTEKLLCDHQANSITDSNCPFYKALTDDWSEFRDRIDNIGDLGQNFVPNKVRVVTRSQSKKTL